MEFFFDMNISKLALIRFSDEFEVQVVELTSNLKTSKLNLLQIASILFFV